MLALVTPRPASPRAPGRTSVEIFAAAVAGCLASELAVAVVSPGRGRRRQLGGVTYLEVPPGPGRRAPALMRRLLRLGPALVQVENRPLWVSALRDAGFRGPVVLSLHSLTFLRPPRLSLAEARRALDQADAVVCPSRYLARRLRRDLGGPPRRVAVVPRGVDAAAFRPAEGGALAAERRRLRSRWGARGPVVLFAGRIVPQKGLHVLLRACAPVLRGTGSTLVVAGGPRPRPGARGYAGRVYRLARRLRVPVRWLGPVPHGCMPAVFRAADLVAVPSQRTEAFGMVVVEAMASGVPVLASRVGGIPEVLRHGEEGWLVAPHERPEAWRAALARLLGDAGLRRALGLRARAAALERFPWSRAAAALRELYAELAPALAGGHARPA